MAHDVFICYASPDKATADAACATLESRSIRCWIAPRDILSGMDWSEAIIDAIENCKVLVLVFSSRANASVQIKREVERAVNKGRIIVPLRIEDVPPSRSLEYFISTPHWLDALTPPLEQHLIHLADTIRLLLERMAGPEDTLLLKSPLPPRPATASSPGQMTLTRPMSDLLREAAGKLRRAAARRAALPAIGEFETKFVSAFGPVFGGDRLEATAKLSRPMPLSVLAGFAVGVLGVLWNGYALVTTLFPAAGTPGAYYSAIFPMTRFVNILAQAFGLVGSLALVIGAHWASANRSDGARVLGKTARLSMKVVVGWLVLALVTMMMARAWRVHLASSNRSDVLFATFRAALLPFLSLGAVAWLVREKK